MRSPLLPVSACEARGFTPRWLLWIQLPGLPTDTHGMETGKGPIHSRYDDDPAYANAIDDFIVGLAERVDVLQDLEARADMMGLADAVTGLGTEANHLGYPPMVEAAAEVARAARDRNSDLARKSLEDLTDVARRMRQAHRGSL